MSLAANGLQQINVESWVISDTHFYHDNILKYETCRAERMQAEGFSEQTQWLIANWNQCVAKSDLVLHLGDVSFAKPEVLNRLNGRIIMLVGNHDVKKLAFYREYQKKHPEKFWLVEGVVSEAKIECQDSVGVSGLIFSLNQQKLFFSHYPLLSVDPYLRGSALLSRNIMAEIFTEHQCDVCVHGHVHSNDAFILDKAKERNVSLERTDFKPIRLKDVLA